MPKISIIVPVYKVEKYLERCLDSIIAQTFSDWECILIDDGSPDNSGKICDEYAEKDERFVVIHQENAGVSAARNAGLDIAKGEYITFVDSDDWIDSNTYQMAYDVTKNNEVDLVLWGIVYEKAESSVTRNFKVGFFEQDDIINNFEPSTCHKLFRKKIIYENKLFFPEGLTLSEDKYFSFLYLLKSNCVFGIEGCYYHYRIYSGSSTHNMTEKNIKDEVEIIKNMEEVLKLSKIKKDNVFYKILDAQKIEAKNHSLFLLKKPNFVLWRNLYPEVLPKMMKRKGKIVLLYILLILHLDFLARILLKIK